MSDGGNGEGGNGYDEDSSITEGLGPEGSIEGLGIGAGPIDGGDGGVGLGGFEANGEVGGTETPLPTPPAPAPTPTTPAAEEGKKRKRRRRSLLTEEEGGLMPSAPIYRRSLLGG